MLGNGNPLPIVASGQAVSVLDAAALARLDGLDLTHALERVPGAESQIEHSLQQLAGDRLGLEVKSVYWRHTGPATHPPHATASAMAQGMAPVPANVVNIAASGFLEVPQDWLSMSLSTTREGTDAVTVQNQLKVALEQAKGTLAQEQARLNKARADRDRIIPLFKRQVVSRKDYDDTIANYEAAIASRQAAQAKVKEAELNLSYTQVTAPINGMASKSSQSEGSLISTSGDNGLLSVPRQLSRCRQNDLRQPCTMQGRASTGSKAGFQINEP